MAKAPPAKDENGQGTAQQNAPALNVLAQYIKDFSFENPNAPNSLRPRENSPNINIGINVNANALSQTDFEVDAGARSQGDRRRGSRFQCRTALCRHFPGCRTSPRTRCGRSADRMPAAAVSLRPPDHRRRYAQWRLSAADDRSDRFRAMYSPSMAEEQAKALPAPLSASGQLECRQARNRLSGFGE